MSARSWRPWARKAGPEDDRTEEKRFHDALQLACELLPAHVRHTGHSGSNHRI
jgi:hypothetical protein